jgi:hypothetical protein
VTQLLENNKPPNLRLRPEGVWGRKKKPALVDPFQSTIALQREEVHITPYIHEIKKPFALAMIGGDSQIALRLFAERAPSFHPLEWMDSYQAGDRVAEYQMGHIGTMRHVLTMWLWGSWMWSAAWGSGYFGGPTLADVSIKLNRSIPEVIDMAWKPHMDVARTEALHLSAFQDIYLKDLSPEERVMRAQEDSQDSIFVWEEKTLLAMIKTNYSHMFDDSSYNRWGRGLGWNHGWNNRYWGWGWELWYSHLEGIYQMTLPRGWHGPWAYNGIIDSWGRPSSKNYASWKQWLLVSEVKPATLGFRGVR